MTSSRGTDRLFHDPTAACPEVTGLRSIFEEAHTILVLASPDVQHFEPIMELSVNQVAELLSVSRQTIHAWERSDDGFQT